MDRPIPEINRRFGIQVWYGMPCSLGSFIDKHFSIRFYGVGHRWFPNHAIGFVRGTWIEARAATTGAPRPPLGGDGGG